MNRGVARISVSASASESGGEDKGDEFGEENASCSFSLSIEREYVAADRAAVGFAFVLRVFGRLSVDDLS